MPTSDPIILTAASSKIRELNPTSVLDIGIGIGKWGVLTREYTDVWHHKRFYEKDWATFIVGIEIHKEYQNPVWDIYDGILVGDASNNLDIVSNLYGHFDLGIMIDVLEHFQKDVGVKVVEKLLTLCTHLLISYSNCEQKGICPNIFEDHLSKWSFSDFPPTSQRILSGENESWGLFLLSK